MIAIAKASDTEREVLFGNAAYRAGISNPAIVEKDFWVCFALDYCSHFNLFFASGSPKKKDRSCNDAGKCLGIRAFRHSLHL